MLPGLIVAPMIRRLDLFTVYWRGVRQQNQVVQNRQQS